MSEPITLTLPMPPSTNNLYFSFVTKARKVIRVPSDRAKEFKAQVERICRQQDVTPFAGEVVMTIRVYRPRRVGDTDGYLKATIDSLTGFAYHDDKQVRIIHAYRYDDPKRPRCEVEIKALNLC